MKERFKLITLAILASIVWVGAVQAAIRPSDWVAKPRPAKEAVCQPPKNHLQMKGVFYHLHEGEVKSLGARVTPGLSNVCVQYLRKTGDFQYSLALVPKNQCTGTTQAEARLNPANCGLVIAYPMEGGKVAYMAEETAPKPPTPPPVQPPLPSGDDHTIISYNSAPITPTLPPMQPVEAGVEVEAVNTADTNYATKEDVRVMYRQLLGRSASSGEIWQWRNRLTRSGTVGEIREGIKNSREYADWQVCKEDFQAGEKLGKSCREKIQAMLGKKPSTPAKKESQEKRSKPSKEGKKPSGLKITGEKAGVPVSPPYIGCPRGENHLFQGQVDEVIHFLVCRPKRQKGLDNKGYTLLMGHLNDLRVVSVPQAKILKTDCGRFSTYRFGTPHGELVIRPFKDKACDGGTLSTWQGKELFARYR